MSNQRDRNARGMRDERTPPIPPTADRASAPFDLDATARITAPSDPLDEPMTAPTRSSRTLTSSPAVTRSRRATTGARRTPRAASGASDASDASGTDGPTAQALAPLKTGAERERALAAINAAGDTATTVIPGARKYRAPALTIVPRRSGPRSAVAQFVVSMIVTALLVSALALSTPLGKAAALDVSGATQSYSGVTPWLPTPTPTRKPTPKPSYLPPAGANPGQQAIIDQIVAVFGTYSQGALAIAKCESGYDPNAWNSYPIMNSHASGVFQILYPSTWNTTSYASSSPFNADANIHAAYLIFQRDGYSWREWQCQP